ncbi:bifunctional folylpolyglutamate synthase/dihydrofolate synthase [Phaeovibrio sulfidiphilus]|uniref:Dihydrofolate synthase/folylpolyglutamate synthase n=1 Tax=Phaeovibrio sulfidiphilus TaxID=1220600 RepID=A0A8J7CE33_9PROT|nr:folylpolyglutamate synthase/dihydrofolate synthase family protein [Phaeovibrio sulfidiphilus]MBE1237504.1 bifunctional folylpolyglutamate synthase/dihydrofolate synthase [Phaeovibrio sulfidiphilus]
MIPGTEGGAARVHAILERLSGLHPSRIDLTLDRVWRLLEALGNPQDHLNAPVVHIAGTNGKGSTAACIRAALETAGHTVHTYTSPHLVRFNERIRVAGDLISDDRLAALLEEVESANAGLPITFFEITTVAAFLAFARTRADAVILETGLGGRLDATNVVTKRTLGVITPVALDHQAYLGNTLEEIAREKAAILKAGTGVSARQEPEVLRVLEARARDAGCRLLVEGRDWSVESTGDGFRVHRAGGETADYPRPALAGAHQKANAALADQVLEVLGDRGGTEGAGLATTTAERSRAFSREVTWAARMQPLDRGRLVESRPAGTRVWLDGGHNAHAAAALASLVREWSLTGPVDMVLGMIETKDPKGYLEPLVPWIRRLAVVPVRGGQTGAGMDAGLLARIAAETGAREVRVFADPEEALASLDAPNVLIGGSLYLAGDILERNGTPP